MRRNVHCLPAARPDLAGCTPTVLFRGALVAIFSALAVAATIPAALAQAALAQEAKPQAPAGEKAAPSPKAPAAPGTTPAVLDKLPFFLKPDAGPDARRATGGGLTADTAPPADRWKYSNLPPDRAFAAYQRGYFVTAFKEAMKRIETKQDATPAMTLIAELFKDGLGFRRDPAEAARWYKLAASQGDRQAAFALGKAYLTGSGVKKDVARARELFAEAAEKNHGGALYNLGVMAMEGESKEKPGNFAKAAELFQKAAEAGDLDAIYSLAVFYRRGTGVPLDPIKSTSLLKIAADQYHIGAMVEYAIAQFNGIGTAKDEEGAAKYFIKAAWKNAPVAQNRLARMYAAGRGVKKDMVQAMKWHIIARASGINDKWLNSKLPGLTRTQRQIVNQQVMKFAGK